MSEARSIFPAPTRSVLASQAHLDARRITALEAELGAQKHLIEEQAHSLRHNRATFERAAAAARIGIWECDLSNEELRWSDGIYDMFDLPRDTVQTRNETLAYYSPDSVETLQRIRSKAIEDRSGFQLDAEILTPKGRRRWIRVTATVECKDGVPMRIFGIKQDITEEKLLSDRTRYLAEFDVMTGLANRSRFQSRLTEATASDEGRRPIGGLILVDLDGFKQINDRFGHPFGDACLKVAAARLAEVCTSAELVARIGGDEFAVLVAHGHDLAEMDELAARIVATVGQPATHDGRSFGLGASVGIASMDAAMTAETLFRHADTALYAAKAAGRNTHRSFDPSMLHD